MSHWIYFSLKKINIFNAQRSIDLLCEKLKEVFFLCSSNIAFIFFSSPNIFCLSSASILKKLFQECFYKHLFCSCFCLASEAVNLQLFYGQTGLWSSFSSVLKVVFSQSLYSLSPIFSCQLSETAGYKCLEKHLQPWAKVGKLQWIF